MCYYCSIIAKPPFTKPPFVTSRIQAAPNVLLLQTRHFRACRARRGSSRRLAKSSPYAGPSAGPEVARLRKWHAWCLLADRSRRLTASVVASSVKKPSFDHPKTDPNPTETNFRSLPGPRHSCFGKLLPRGVRDRFRTANSRDSGHLARKSLLSRAQSEGASEA